MGPSTRPPPHGPAGYLDSRMKHVPRERGNGVSIGKLLCSVGRADLTVAGQKLETVTFMGGSGWNRTV